MSEVPNVILEAALEFAHEQIRELRAQVKFFADEQDFWRRKYLAEHPDQDNWDYAETARDEEPP